MMLSCGLMIDLFLVAHPIHTGELGRITTILACSHKNTPAIA
jgi:hypothetical protein